MFCLRPPLVMYYLKYDFVKMLFFRKSAGPVIFKSCSYFVL